MVFHLKLAPLLGAWSLIILLGAGGLLVIVPEPVRAVNSDWTHEIVNGVTDTMTQMALAHKGEVLGLAYKRQSDSKIAFTIRTAGCTGNTCWIAKTSSIEAGGVAAHVKRLVPISTSGVWLLLTTGSIGSAQVWRTTDDGATWTNVSPTFGSGAGGGCNDLSSSGTFVALATCSQAGGGGQSEFRYSGDGGVTWSSPFNFANNAGSPTGTATANDLVAQVGVGADATLSVLVLNGQIYTTWRSNGPSDTGPARMRSVGVPTSDVGGFWTVAYGGSGGVCYVDLGTNPCFWYSGGVNYLNVDGSGAGTPIYSFVDSGVWKSFTSASSPLTGSQSATTVTTETVDSCSSGLKVGNSHSQVHGNSANTYIAAMTCSGSPAGLSVRLKAGTSGTWADTYTDTAVVSQDVAVGMTDTKSYVLYTNGAVGNRPELVWASTPTAAAPAGASATVTVGATLSGFDVDPLDRVVVIRNAASLTPSAIRTYDPSTLTLLGASPLANGCNKVDGVMAYSPSLSDSRPFAGFLDCTSSSTQANTLSIRNNLLGTPSQTNTVCTDFCDIDLQTASGGTGVGDVCAGSQSQTLPGGATEIGNIVGVPISWDNGVNPGGLRPKNTMVGFAFTDVGNGNVGAWVIEQRNNNADKSCGLEVAFGPIAATKEITTWRAADGNDYLAAVGDTVSGKLWRMDITRGATGANDLAEPDSLPNVELPQVYPFQSPNDKALGLGCALEYCTLLRPDGVVAKVHVLGTGLGTTTTIATGALTLGRAVTVSRDGNAVAYLTSATTVAVAALTDNPYGLTAPAGTVLTTFTIPTGTFKAMRLDDTARNLYIATSTTISRFDVSGTGTVGNQPLGTRGQGAGQTCIKADGTSGTCVVPTSSNTLTGGAGASACDTETATVGIYSPKQVCLVGQGLGGGKTAGGIYIAIILIVGMGFGLPAILYAVAQDNKGVFTIPKSAYIAVGAGGAILGFMLSWGLSLIATTVLFVILILVLGVSYGKLLLRRQGA